MSSIAFADSQYRSINRVIMSGAYLMLPGGISPPGIIPNFVNPESRGPVSVIACTIAMVLMMSFVLVRFYAKLAVIRKWNWDDCSI